MKFAIGTNVKLTSVSKDWVDAEDIAHIGKEGAVVSHFGQKFNEPNKGEPLHIVVFYDGYKSAFWPEELEGIPSAGVVEK